MVIRDWVVAIAVIYVAVRYALLREQERASMRADLFVSGSCWHYPMLPNTGFSAAGETPLPPPTKAKVKLALGRSRSALPG